ncbi:hypothetical protein D3H64_09965 [Atopobacter sp. AH10]|uniref:hypothetical protein n=1 Tax=Atopobacter sp. AH10 TaxID=2315861 RepID=UPI000EF25C25|nr:hypothetical protein [Atopobacter sp. AH10]RLK62403.1 hypothetical protein D3H64_09965 [Atopobacter sp. AH10]
MNLLNYNNKKIVLNTKSGNTYEGMAYYCNADEYETEEDELTIKNKTDGKYYGFAESEIKSIEII